MKILEKIYNVLDKLLNALIAVLMIVITLWVLAQVVFRYFLHRSMRGFEELPVFILIALVWIGGVLVAKRDDHVKIDLITQSIKSQRGKALLAAFNSLITAASTALYTVYCYSFVMNAYVNQSVSPGIRFPLWYIYIVTLICSGLGTLCFSVNTLKAVRRVFQ